MLPSFVQRYWKSHTWTRRLKVSITTWRKGRRGEIALPMVVALRSRGLAVLRALLLWLAGAFDGRGIRLQHSWRE